MKDPGRVIVAKALKTMLEKEIGVTFTSNITLQDGSNGDAWFTVEIFGNLYIINVAE